MPRRKRKRTSTELPRLKFVESPSNDSAPRLSPELGAINPITARAVPVDGIPDLSWVTPQFGGKRNLYRQITVNQANRRSTRLRGNKSSDVKNLDPKLYDASSKYKPLSFISSSDSNTRQRKDGYTRKKNDGRLSHNLNVEDTNTVTDINRLSPANVSGNDSFPESFKVLTPVLNNENNLLITATTLLSSHQKLKNCDEQFNTNNSGPKDGYSANDSRCDKESDSQKSSAVFSKVKIKRPFLLDFPSSPPPSPNPEVLAMDTPECDYDLTLRQRQIKYLLRTRPR